MEDPKLDFVGSNPGAVRHGNFINYYEFHPAQERVKNLPSNIWKSDDLCADKPFVSLDIGCNTGELTMEIMKFLQTHLVIKGERAVKIHMVGVDIDHNLISRAKEAYQHDVELLTLDVSQEGSNSALIDICEKHGVSKYGAVFLMSVTMWVHLVNGDEAFHQFLKKCADLSSDWLVIESQPWKCYRSAQRRLVSSGDSGFPNYSKLAIKGDKLQPFVDKVLSEECQMDKIFESPPSKWNRTICVYKKR